MDILHLSEDLLISIFEYLDLESRLVLYGVCRSFQTLLQSKYLALRSYKLSFCNKRWSSILTNPYFSASREYLVKLDLTGLRNLQSHQQTDLKSAIVVFSNLEVLNIGYTDLKMPDCLEICPKLPKLVKLCVNFDWSERVDFTDDMLLSYRQAFKDVELLHFIGHEKLLLDTDVLLYMSEPDKPKELRLTLIVARYITTREYTFDEIKNRHSIFPFKKMTVENCAHNFLEMQAKLFRCTALNLKFEMIISEYREYDLANYILLHVFVTSNLLPVVQQNDVTLTSVIKNKDFTKFEHDLGQCKIVMWHKDYYTKQFFNKIRDYLSSALPVGVRAKNVEGIKSYRGSSDTFYMCNCAFETKHISDVERIFSDTTLIRKMKLGKSISCACEGPVRFKGNSFSFPNLKYLCLMQFYFRDTELNDVMSCCPNLETFLACGREVAESEKQLTIDFAKYGKRLKNICLLYTDVNIVLRAVSLYPTLETALVTNHSSPAVERKTICNLIEKCPNLSYLAIPLSTSPNSISEYKRQRDILNIVINHRPNFEYRLIDMEENFILNLPRERVFLLNDSFTPENIY